MPTKFLLLLSLGACAGSGYASQADSLRTLAHRSPPSPQTDPEIASFSRQFAIGGEDDGREVDFEGDIIAELAHRPSEPGASDTAEELVSLDEDDSDGTGLFGRMAARRAARRAARAERAQQPSASDVHTTLAPRAQADPLLAQNDVNAQQEPVATDAISSDRPLIIYTAQIYLGAYDIVATQEQIIATADELGGFLARRTDRGLIIRVPAHRFEAAMQSVQEAGDVLRRDVSAEDVSEEFRDTEIRMRNAETMLERLQELLGRADTVTDALAIESQIQRLTEQLELLKGKLRRMADRISFSTITVHFTPLATEDGRIQSFQLPFPWLNELGLTNLMRL